MSLIELLSKAAIQANTKFEFCEGGHINIYEANIDGIFVKSRTFKNKEDMIATISKVWSEERLINQLIGHTILVEQKISLQK